MRAVVVTTLLAAVLAALVGLAFAGSSARLAEGVTVAGIDVGGLTQAEALNVLENRAERVATVPVVFTAGEDRFPIKASTLGVRADWSAAITSAMQESEGFGPVRGYKRLHARFFGAEIAPPVQASDAIGGDATEREHDQRQQRESVHRARCLEIRRGRV